MGVNGLRAWPGFHRGPGQVPWAVAERLAVRCGDTEPELAASGLFECLSRHGVTHVFNSWEAMPPAAKQVELPGIRTKAGLVAARFLLKPGRRYEDAVKTFEPYDRVKEENPEARAAAKALIEEGKKAGPARKTFVFVNNRLEGNALTTIAAVMES